MIVALHGLAFTPDNVILTEFFTFFLALATAGDPCARLSFFHISRTQNGKICDDFDPPKEIKLPPQLDGRFQLQSGRSIPGLGNAILMPIKLF